MKRLCCDMMVDQLNHICDELSDPCNCSNIFIKYISRFDEHGFIIRDGDPDFTTIHYCPWCGSKLSDSKRDLWFDTLKDLGFTDPLNQPIPEEFQNHEWYQGKRRGNA